MIRHLTLPTIACAMFLCAGFAHAQNPFTFGAPDNAAPAPAAAPADAQFGNGLTGDLVIDTVKESEPTTPTELLRAVQVLFDYGATADALNYLQQLQDANPDAATLAALAEEFGEGFLIRLLTDKRMQPRGKEFSLAALKAYHDHVRDPQRLAGLIDALSSESPQRRASAQADLRQANDAAVDQLMIVLANPARNGEHKVVRDTMSLIHPPALDMALAALRSENPTLKRNAILVIGRVGDRRAAGYLIEPFLSEEEHATVRQAAAASLAQLLGGLPSHGAALEFLDTIARRYEAGALVSTADDADRVPAWQWNDEPPGFRQLMLRSDDASLAAAADLTGALYRIEPARVDVRRRYLLAELKRAKVFGGYSEPITATQPAVVQQLSLLGPAVFDDLLQTALDQNQIAAATAAAEMLGEVGDLTLLATPNGRPRALAQALSHGDPRVRFAAASAIVKLAPTLSYAGASRFAEAAAHFVSTEDIRQAVVCDPRESRTHEVAGLLGAVDVEGLPTYSGIDSWKAAASSSDVEYALLSWAIDRPNINETLQTFRTDKRTKRMPIAVMTDEAHRQRLEYLTANDPLSIVVTFPHNAKAIAMIETRLLGLLDRDYVPVEERVAQARAALGWFEAVALSPETQPNHDLLRHRNVLQRALFVPALSKDAARVLGALGTPQSQAALVELASQNGRPLPQRKAAAEAFAQAIDLRGVGLTREDIVRQYDRYNDSRTLPVETQQVLGSLLDSIERPTRAATPPTNPLPVDPDPADSTPPTSTQ